MFGAELQEPWTQLEKEEFEKHAAIRLRACISSAAKTGVALLINLLILAPFLAGHRLNIYWEKARLLLFPALLLFLWFVQKVALVWASWQSSREVRRGYEESN